MSRPCFLLSLLVLYLLRIQTASSLHLFFPALRRLSPPSSSKQFAADFHHSKTLGPSPVSTTCIFSQKQQQQRHDRSSSSPSTTRSIQIGVGTVQNALQNVRELTQGRMRQWTTRRQAAAAGQRVSFLNHKNSKSPKRLQIIHFLQSLRCKEQHGHRGLLLSTLITAALWSTRPSGILAMTPTSPTKTPVLPMKKEQLISAVSLWFFLFVVLALLHAAEIAITTLYPWKVKEFAEEEEKQNAGSNRKGTFAILNQDITRVLTTILVSSTAASIYATTIFTHVVSSVFGPRGDTYGAIALTGITLFFVELLPKSIGVTNAERVARFMVPPINLISAVVSPLGFSLSWLSKQVLNILGLKGKEGVAGVSDSELRLIVMGARDSGTIDHSEQEMIKGVLNLQSRLVREIMRPRVDVVAVPKEMSVASVLAIVRESGYSRIPVYDEEIDNIIGIVLAKSVLDFFVQGVLVENHKVSEQDSLASYSLRSFNGQATKGYVRALTGAELASRMEKSITDADLIEECYFVPATANGWAVLQEMRKRRVHIAIVVDEYGGTEGLVSLEDIVEEVVGEIYDEDDDASYEFSEDSITLQEDGSFLIRGEAELEDCDLILGLKLVEEKTLKDFGTLSGFLCMCAGEIPKVGDVIMSRGWSFEIIDADPKRILQVKVARLVGFLDDNGDEEEDNPLLGFLRKGLGKQKSMDDVDYIPDAEFSAVDESNLNSEQMDDDNSDPMERD